MTTLSIVEELDDGRHLARVIAAPLFPISSAATRPGSTLVFELLERDATALSDRVGRACLYAIGSNGTFWAKLNSLEPCVSTHEGLAYMRDRPTLRATFTIYGDIEQARPA